MGVRAASQMKTSRIARSIIEAFVYLRGAADRVKCLWRERNVAFVSRSRRPNSAVALAVADIARDKNKVFIGSGAGTALLTGARCSPNTVHWTYDTWAMGHGVARGLLQQGGKTWFFVTADYAFGDDLQKQASEQVNAEGGQVLGSVRL